jgi:hypothetical protein
MSRFAAKEQVHPASTLEVMNDELVLQALEGMRTEVAAVTQGITGLTNMVVTLQSDVDVLKTDVREIRRDVSDLRSATTEHLNWHLGQAS